MTYNVGVIVLEANMDLENKVELQHIWQTGHDEERKCNVSYRVRQGGTDDLQPDEL